MSLKQCRETSELWKGGHKNIESKIVIQTWEMLEEQTSVVLAAMTFSLYYQGNLREILHKDQIDIHNIWWLMMK